MYIYIYVYIYIYISDYIKLYFPFKNRVGFLLCVAQARFVNSERQCP